MAIVIFGMRMHVVLLKILVVTKIISVVLRIPIIVSILVVWWPSFVPFFFLLILVKDNEWHGRSGNVVLLLKVCWGVLILHVGGYYH